MHALVYTGTQKLEYQKFDDPTLIQGESIVKVSASGICGSDMHAYHGKDERRVPPLILGHEVSGIIQQGIKKGKKVVLNPLITCGKCYYCNNGREHLCPDRALLGMNKPVVRQGCFAELVVTPDKNIYELPNNLDIKKAPIAEPTAVALHAVELGHKILKKPLDQSRVLIIGGGAIGLLCALILEKYKKCKEIILIDPNEKRLKVCGDSLDSETLKPDNKLIKKNSFDVIFDTVGLEITRQNSIKCVNSGGIIVHIGLTQPEGTFNFRKATLQEITFVGTYCYTNKDFENTLRLLSSEKLGSLQWIEFKELSKGADAFKQIHDGSCSAPKIILIP
ncbi:alcohol dehydrogenase catalytic domain-containing protein [Candidatus Pelagibacter sp.]|nr:alcohol dehydrogenase catalytic domain-containing protein [Candidatus Pelagibacter sp.]